VPSYFLPLRMKIHARTKTTIMTIAMIMVVFIGESPQRAIGRTVAYISQPAEKASHSLTGACLQMPYHQLTKTLRLHNCQSS
jgi:hypothetical protein